LRKRHQPSTVPRVSQKPDLSPPPATPATLTPASIQGHNRLEARDEVSPIPDHSREFTEQELLIPTPQRENPQLFDDSEDRHEVRRKNKSKENALLAGMIAGGVGGEILQKEAKSNDETKGKNIQGILVKGHEPKQPFASSSPVPVSDLGSTKESKRRSRQSASSGSGGAKEKEAAEYEMTGKQQYELGERKKVKGFMDSLSGVPGVYNP
jgi:hypothetical protein